MPCFSPSQSPISPRYHFIHKCISLVHHLIGGKESEVNAPSLFLKDKPPGPQPVLNLLQLPLDERLHGTRIPAPCPLYLGSDEKARRVHLRYFLPNLFFHVHAHSVGDSKLGIEEELYKTYSEFYAYL